MQYGFIIPGTEIPRVPVNGWRGMRGSMPRRSGTRPRAPQRHGFHRFPGPGRVPQEFQTGHDAGIMRETPDVNDPPRSSQRWRSTRRPGSISSVTPCNALSGCESLMQTPGLLMHCPSSWARCLRLPGGAPSPRCCGFFTRILLPPISRAFSSLIATLACPARGITAKPNPLVLPVTLSITSLQYCTAAYSSNRGSSFASVVLRDRLRTRIYMIVPLMH